MNILVTGGAGYIGSVTSALLRQTGHTVVIFDSLQTGHKEAIGQSRLIVGDLTNKDTIDKIFSSEEFDAVVHFAALSLAGQSMERPYDYYYNNLLGSLNLLESMRLHGCGTIIFSSTSAVYGYPKVCPITEDQDIAPVSVYGSSKHMIEEIIGWYDTIYGIKSVLLRYFNAAGALLDGTMGEDHANETHIIPLALAVASGKRDVFELFGNDYETPDGTCIRDYIHVLDLADAHIRALDFLTKNKKSEVINLGVGRGYSNKEVLDVVLKITGKQIHVEVKPRRPGDPAQLWADNTKAKRLLGWVPQHSDIETIISSAWAWHKNHPNGYFT
ncbi:UDP-glucose 4-epimerase GalE [Candidatus Gottesmanbacteria bacterium]|nr:UDP-glucose 4-epimerase GalE [Candidatus Gottesmanbacteria bacterium]